MEIAPSRGGDSFSESVVYVNPAAGGRRAHGVWRDLLERRPELSTARSVVESDRETGRRHLVEALRSGAQRLLVVGGDGTLQLAVNALLEAGAEEVPIGLVPAGTGSDLARFLNLPRRPVQALEHALSPSRMAAPRRLDLLEVSTEDGRRVHCVNAVSAGLSGVVDEIVNAIPGRGPLTYLLGALRGLARYRPAACRVFLDDEPFYEGEILLLALANGSSFGKGMKIAPRAQVDDGRMEVVLVRPVPLWQIPFRLPQLFLGWHLGASAVSYRRASRARLEPLGELPPLDLDGEVFPMAPVEVRVVPGILRFLA